MKKKVGFAFCGSFCTHKICLEQLKDMSEKYDVYPIVSETVYSTSTRFGDHDEFVKKIKDITGKNVCHTVKEAERFGPEPLDMLIICPCTGNTLAKIAQGITDTSVCMAAKATYRCERPVVLALASNDAMGANLSNIGYLLNRKDNYFVPLVQDDPIKKPHSLVCDFSKLGQTADAAFEGKQIRPLFI